MYDKPILKRRKNPNNPSKREILVENLLDAFIDGCIAGFMTGWLVNPEVAPRVTLATGLLKFFIRLKELRGKT